MIFSIQQVEEALNRCIKVHPSVDRQLQEQPGLMCEIWGKMICDGTSSLDCVFQSKLDTDSTAKWTLIPR